MASSPHGHSHSHGGGDHGHSHGGHDDDDHGHGHGHDAKDIEAGPRSPVAAASPRSASGHGHSHGGAPCSGHGDEEEEEGDHGHSHAGGGHGHSHGSSSPKKKTDKKALRELVDTASGGCGHDHGSSEPLLGDGEGESSNAWARRKLLMAGGLCLLFMGGEFAGGFLAHSLAIMTDAAHLLSDVAGFLISLTAVWLAEKAPTAKLTFGYHRYEIMGAVMSVVLIWGITGVLIYEAINRFIDPPKHVDGKVMFITATAGLCVNLMMMKILHQDVGGSVHGHSHSHGGHGHGAHGHGENINVRAAFIHVIGDLIQSIGVMIAAACIWAFGHKAQVADPICTVIFSILVIFTTVNIMKQAVKVLLNSVPEHVQFDGVLEDLQAVRGVTSVHDLHIWAISSKTVALSVHLLAHDATNVLSAAQKVCKRHGINHTTIQIERAGTNDLDNCNAINVVCDSSLSLGGVRPL